MRSKLQQNQQHWTLPCQRRLWRPRALSFGPFRSFFAWSFNTFPPTPDVKKKGRLLHNAAWSRRCHLIFSSAWRWKDSDWIFGFGWTPLKKHADENTFREQISRHTDKKEQGGRCRDKESLLGICGQLRSYPQSLSSAGSCSVISVRQTPSKKSETEKRFMMCRHGKTRGAGNCCGRR